MEINTKRCTICPFKEEYIDDFMEYRNDLEWMRFQDFKGLTRQEYAKALLKDIVLERGVQLAIIDNTQNKLIGDIYLKQDNSTFWVGYTICPSSSRQGYAYEVVEAIINWIRQNGGMSVKAGVSPENLASIGLLKKLNFVYTTTDESGDHIFTLIL